MLGGSRCGQWGHRELLGRFRAGHRENPGQFCGMAGRREALKVEGASLRIGVVKRNGVTLIKLVGRVDVANHFRIRDEMGRLAKEGCRWIVVDLSELQSFASSMFAVFAHFGGEMRQNGGCLLLASPAEALHRAIQATHLEALFEVCNTVEEAVSKAEERRSISSRAEARSDDARTEDAGVEP